jgi:hypothetical protein
VIGREWDAAKERRKRERCKRRKMRRKNWLRVRRENGNGERVDGVILRGERERSE